VRLLRPIYGLKTERTGLTSWILIGKGLKRLQSSNCLYRKGFCTYLIVYVDDILIFPRYKKETNEIVQVIGEEYKIRDLGEVSYFLVTKIKRDPGGISLNQNTYIKDVIHRFKMEECKPLYISHEPGIILTKQDSSKSEDKTEKMRNILYQMREIISYLNYISQCICSDITLTVTKLAQFLSNPHPLGHIHWIV